MVLGGLSKSKLLSDLVPAIYSLAILDIGIGIMTKTMLIPIALEIRQRVQEFKKMNVVEIEFNDKNKKEIEYRDLKTIDRFTKKFLKENSKWVCEEEVIADIKTGRYIFTRIYRTYYIETLEEDYCECCGREY